MKTIVRHMVLLSSALTQHDAKECKREAKRGIPNVHRLGLLFQAANRMREQLPDPLDVSTPEGARVLATAIRKAFQLRCTDKLADQIEREASQ